MAAVEQGLAEADHPEVETAEPAESPATVTDRMLKTLWTEASRAHDRWKKADKIATDLQAQSREKLKEVEARAAELAEREKAAAAKDAELAELERQLALERIKAEEGFADLNREATADLATKRAELRADIDRLEAEAQGRIHGLEAAARAELAQAQQVLRAAQDELIEAQREHQLAVRDFESAKAIFEIDQAHLRKECEHKVELAAAELEMRLSRPTRLLELEQELRTRAEAELADLRERLAAFADPDAVLQENEDLTARVGELEDLLATMPTPDQLQDLRRAASQTSAAQREALEWRRRHDAVDQALQTQLIGVGELEMVRESRDAMEAQNKALRDALAKMRDDWIDLQAKEASKRPFVALSSYDEDGALQKAVRTRDVTDLRDLAEEVRNRMAYQWEYFYAAPDVRIFLSGLAASRLHLLQGISGTGKTSLPIQFFKALGGESTVVEVQAGWRDQDDLLGFYNAFEKRYTETEFTKALYRALMPSERDRPTVIVLDEMNLAHPEQYFSTMLSKLENAGRDRVMADLLNSPIENVPSLFHEGSKMPLAPNVWFVGTANHDETTVAFADKTYDRSHVQELPHAYQSFEPPAPKSSIEPISFESLTTAFSEAAVTYAKEATEVTGFLNNELRPQFARFGIGWGNRLESQVSNFVPVNLAAGGSINEAADHIVATKLVRKLKDRFDVGPEQLEALRGKIEHSWDRLPGNETPAKTLGKFDEEIIRLNGSQF